MISTAVNYDYHLTSCCGLNYLCTAAICIYFIITLAATLVLGSTEIERPQVIFCWHNLRSRKRCAGETRELARARSRNQRPIQVFVSHFLVRKKAIEIETSVRPRDQQEIGSQPKKPS